jgi:hypothetical protein
MPLRWPRLSRAAAGGSLHLCPRLRPGSSSVLSLRRGGLNLLGSGPGPIIGPVSSLVAISQRIPTVGIFAYLLAAQAKAMECLPISKTAEASAVMMTKTALSGTTVASKTKRRRKRISASAKAAAKGATDKFYEESGTHGGAPPTEALLAAAEHSGLDARILAEILETARFEYEKALVMCTKSGSMKCLDVLDIEAREQCDQEGLHLHQRPKDAAEWSSFTAKANPHQWRPAADYSERMISSVVGEFNHYFVCKAGGPNNSCWTMARSSGHRCPT